MASMENMVNIKDMKPMSRVDCHSHILPDIDDGSQSVAQSHAMLQEEKAHGIIKVLASPHFYPDEPSVVDFVKKRQEAYEELMAYLQKMGGNFPEIIQGAEVLLGVETAQLPNLRELAIGQTDYILIELPYAKWQSWVYQGIERIRTEHGLIPIIAHLERYVPFQERLENIYELMLMPDVLGQINTRSLLDKESRRLCLKLIQHNLVHVIGSDAHRVRHLEEIEKAYQLIARKYGEEKLLTLHQQGNALLNNQRIQKPMPTPLKRLGKRFYF